LIARLLVSRWFPLLLAGALASRAFAPWDWHWAAFPSLMLLFHYWSNARTPARAFRDGWFWGLGLFGFGIFWLHISIDQYGNLGTPAAMVIALVFIAYLALFPALAGWLVARLRGGSATANLVILMPAAFVLGEWLRGWLFTGFPWLLLGYTQTDTPLAALAPLGGVWLLSWLVALASGLLLATFGAGWRMRAAVAALAVCLWFGLPWLRQRHWTTSTGEAFEVSIVQANIAQRDKWKPEQLRPTLDLYASMSETVAGRSRLILWPETAVPSFLHRIDAYWLKPLARRLRAKGSDLLLGIPVAKPGSKAYFNAVARPANDAKPAIYAKRHLVPFGEYAPLAALTRPVIDALGIPMAAFSPGTAARPLLNAAGYPAGISICYEDIFSREVVEALPDAAFLINVSNDAWFGDSAAPWQHLQMARMRAMESGRFMLRATNTGVSAIIGPNGELKARSGLMKREILSAKAMPMGGMTPYMAIGPYAVPALLTGLLALIAWRRHREHANSGIGQNPARLASK